MDTSTVADRALVACAPTIGLDGEIFMFRVNTGCLTWLICITALTSGCALRNEESGELRDIGTAIEPIFAERDLGATPSHYVVAYDANNAYFTSLAGEFCTSGTWVQKMSLSSGAVSPLVSGACRSAAEAASDGRDLFFLEWDADDVRRVPVAGGPDTFTNDSQNAIVHRGIAVNGSRVFWADARGIRSAPKTGGAGVTIASASDANLIGIDATHAYFDCRSSIANRRDLRRVPLSGGTVQVVHTNLRGHGPATLIGSHVLFASREPSGTDYVVAIERVLKTGGTATTLHVLTGCINRSISALAGDATSLFWSESTQCTPTNRHSIKRRSQPGGVGAVFSVRETMGASYGLHVTSSRLFWIDGPLSGRRLFTAHRDDASCLGSCGAAPPMGCFCDSACAGFGDCCFDAASACG